MGRANDSRSPVRLRVRRAACAAACLLALAASARAEEEPAASTPAAPASLEGLDSPFWSDREEAVEALAAGLPETRAAVLDAFRKATGRRQGLLARVLAADGSPAALDALLAALPTASDPATATAIRGTLVANAERIADPVAAWKSPDGEVPAAVLELRTLIERARVESLFLSRKSRTGTTGTYPGQFEVLKPHRVVALDVCLGILLDRPVKLRGQFAWGTYRWLRPPDFVVEKLELRYMALHALGELATPEDEAIVSQLEELGTGLRVLLDGRFDARKLEAEIGLLVEVVAVLARLKRDPWRMFAESLIREFEGREDHLDEAAGLCLRLGEYQRAVDNYKQLRRTQGGANSSYNLACAYSRWSQEVGGAAAAAHRREALNALERAHSLGYVDWSWMTEDRDLDAVRDDPRFAALVKAMKDAFRLPPEPKPPGRAPGAGGRSPPPGTEGSDASGPEAAPAPAPPPAMDGASSPAMGALR